jgi:hypothetical protein
MNEHGASVGSAWRKPSKKSLCMQFLNSAVNGEEWPASHPGHSNPRDKSPWYQYEAGWVPEPSWTFWKRKYLDLPGLELWIVQSIA